MPEQSQSGTVHIKRCKNRYKNLENVLRSSRVCVCVMGCLVERILSQSALSTEVVIADYTNPPAITNLGYDVGLHGKDGLNDLHRVHLTTDHHPRVVWPASRRKLIERNRWKKNVFS